MLSNVEFNVLGSIKLVNDLNLDSIALLFVVMVFFVGFGEELIFRRILQGGLETKIGLVGAIVLTSIIFAAMHSGYSSIPYSIYVFFVSLFLGYTYHRTDSLGLVSLMHGMINVFLFSFLPFGYLVLFR